MRCQWFASLACMIAAAAVPALAADVQPEDRPIPEAVDHYIGLRLDEAGVRPAPAADDAAIVRRVMLDLAGRIPTAAEAQAFVLSMDPAKREQLVDRLIASPAYVRHNAREFDRLLGAENENAPSLEPYLLSAIAERKPWDRMLADLLGVSDEPNDAASRFIAGRLSDRDSLTRDISSVLFGVNVSCCQCHDHPTVDYLTQDYYFGLKAFFHRSHDFQGRLVERAYAEPLKFQPRKGSEQAARYLLISGTAVDVPEPDVPDLKQQIEEEDMLIAQLREKFGERKEYPAAPAIVPRKLLLETALQPSERNWLAQSIVNRLWYRFLGRGLVMRVDQMHPENPASHPELLDWLARDFIAHGYDLHRLIRGLVMSDVYARSSVWDSGDAPSENLFAVAQVRTLTPIQYAVSLRVASRADVLRSDLPAEAFDQELVKLEDEARQKLAALFPVPNDDLQIGVNEALRLSNDPELLQVLGEGLVTTLLPGSADDQGIEDLYWATLSRAPDAAERSAIQEYLHAGGAEPAADVQAKLARITAHRKRIPQLQREIAAHATESLARAQQAHLARTRDYLAIAAEQSLRPDAAGLPRQLAARGLDPTVYENWRIYLGLNIAGPDEDARHILRNRFTQVLDQVSGNPQVVGLGALETPSVIVNLSDQQAQWFPPHRLTVHPSPRQSVVVGWQSPITGHMRIRTAIRDLDAGGGNGVAAELQLIQSAHPTVLAGQDIPNGGQFQFETPAGIAVHAGDIVAVLIDPLHANHGFDTTDVELVISEADGSQRVWNVAEDVVPDLRQNPHADRHGHEQVWHFAMLGRPVSLAPTGSLVDLWTRALRSEPADAVRLAELGDKVRQLLAGGDTAPPSEGDARVQARLTAPTGPLFVGADAACDLSDIDRVRESELRAELANAEALAAETLSESEQAALDRHQGLWRQVAWAVLTGAEFRFNH